MWNTTMLAVVLSTLVLLGCGNGDSDDGCEPGDRRDCEPNGGGTGKQECLPDGSGWDECRKDVSTVTLRMTVEAGRLDLGLDQALAEALAEGFLPDWDNWPDGMGVHLDETPLTFYADPTDVDLTHDTDYATYRDRVQEVIVDGCTVQTVDNTLRWDMDGVSLGLGPHGGDEEDQTWVAQVPEIADGTADELEVAVTPELTAGIDGAAKAGGSFSLGLRVEYAGYVVKGEDQGSVGAMINLQLTVVAEQE